MHVTLDQIIAGEERLEREILERECLLAATRVLRGHMKGKPGSTSVEVGMLGSLVATPTAVALPKESIELLLDDSTPTAAAPLPAPPRVERYMHPELKAIGTCFGCTSEAVYWAVQRMTADYTVRDILALLRREGYRITSAQASTVLLRMKARNEIECIRSIYGSPCVFRKPEAVQPPEAETPASTATSTADSLTAA
jgi:hypothetical protein